MNLIRLSPEHSPFAVLFVYFIVAFADAVFMVSLWSMKPIAFGIIAFSLIALIPTLQSFKLREVFIDVPERMILIYQGSAEGDRWKKFPFSALMSSIRSYYRKMAYN